MVTDKFQINYPFLSRFKLVCLQFELYWLSFVFFPVFNQLASSDL